MSLPRPVAVLLAALLVATALPLASVLAATPARADQSDTPLTVRLGRLAPAAIPKTGNVVLAGSVTNNSSSTWTTVNVYPFISSTPITDRDQLATAVRTDPAVEVGNRLTDEGRSIGDLAAGATERFRIVLPRSRLRTAISGDSGVYWIGVHALGQGPTGRDSVADGRVRTFIPLIQAPRAHATVAIVVPLRQAVRLRNDGSLADTEHWAALLATGGRFDRLLSLVAAAGTLPVNWLVDPAVLDAAAMLADGNPPLALGPATEKPGAASGTDQNTDEPEAAVSAAADWLNRFRASAKIEPVLGLGYADPDVVALARLGLPMLNHAISLGASTFAEHDITVVPTFAPVDGLIDDATIDDASERTVILASDRGRPGQRSEWRHTSGTRLVFSDARAASGGPAPTTATNALSMRQRILSEAALRALHRLRTPLVVELPDDWDPGDGWERTDFFTSMNQPWLSPASLADPPAGELPTYGRALEPNPTPEQRAARIQQPNIAAARALINVGTTLNQLLDTRNDVQRSLTGGALAATSYQAREDQVAVRVQVGSLTTSMQARMAGVRVVGTDFVTLSGGSGTLTVSLANDLDQPITVGLEPDTGSSSVHIAAPEPVRIGPGQRASMRLEARATSIGVHQVTLTPVTPEGHQLGTALTFSLRTSQVGLLIWAILVAGGALLFAMILRRILHRIRNKRWRP